MLDDGHCMMAVKKHSGQKHVPQRMCAICRQKFEKRDLTRLVHTSNGLVIDKTGKASGRGAYLCGNANCWSKAYQSNNLNHALRVELSKSDKQVLLEHHP